MSKNLKHIIVIFALIMIIVIAGLFYFQKETNQGLISGKSYSQAAQKQLNGTGMEESEKEEVNKITDQDNEIYKAATENNDVSKCSGMSTDEQKDLCVKLIAIKSNDVSLCEKVKNKENLISCEDRVNYKLAKQRNELELCKKISGKYLNISCVTTIISSLQYSKEECEQLDSAQKDVCLTHFLNGDLD
jgi:uncharacterized protein YxeA